MVAQRQRDALMQQVDCWRTVAHMTFQLILDQVAGPVCSMACLTEVDFFAHSALEMQKVQDVS